MLAGCEEQRMPTAGWIGVDLDGTLAHFQRQDDWDGSIGAPVLVMVDRVKRWLSAGRHVRIMTARVSAVAGVTEGPRDVEVQRQLIEAWCEEHLGVRLPVTATKDFHMVELWDDRAVQVIQNTGRAVVDVLGELADQAVAAALEATAVSSVG